MILLSPILAIVAILVKCSSRGPVLFSQDRVGRAGKIFRTLKFRSMIQGADGLGPGITSFGDPRVTQVGKILRRFKLDELPQVWNVLKGQMSFVGPRPELPEYVGGYSPEQRRVLSVRPGITDLASLTYRDEEIILRAASDPEKLYREVILPHKLALGLQYIDQMSLLNDASLILKTLKSAFYPAPAEKSAENPQSGPWPMEAGSDAKRHS